MMPLNACGSMCAATSGALSRAQGERAAPVAALHSTTAVGGVGLMSSPEKSLQCFSDTARRDAMISSQRWLAACVHTQAYPGAQSRTPTCSPYQAQPLQSHGKSFTVQAKLVSQLRAHFAAAGTFGSCMRILQLRAHFAAAGTFCSCGHMLQLRAHFAAAGTFCSCGHIL